METSAVKSRLQRRLASIEERIGAACARSGRPRRDVTLIAVTKTVSVDVAALLPELGVIDLGENRPQELWRKAAVMPATIRWHLVGHLQRNKVDKTLPPAHLIHSVDTPQLLAALEEEATRQVRAVDVLLEFNTSGEKAKHGFAPEEASGLAGQIAALVHVRVLGLMTMAPLEETPERCRPSFAALRSLRDGLRAELGPDHPLPHLSMGMTNDFEVAIEEGATLVRIGTAFFSGLSH